MKKLVFYFALSLIAIPIIAQKVNLKNLPSPVKARFESIYPDIKSVKWMKEDSNYEAEFSENEVEKSALFNAKGDLLETEHEIDITDLPSPVFDYIYNHYDGKKIAEAAQITDLNGVVTFEAQVGNFDVIFDSEGNFKEEKPK